MRAHFHLLIFGAAVCVCLLGPSACGRGNKPVQAAPETNTAETEPPAAAAGSNSSGASNSSNTNVTNVIEGADRSFILQAEKDNLQGRALARIAQEKSQNKDLKDYAKLLTEDHEVALRKTVNLMNKYGVPQPKGLPEERSEALQELKTHSGAAFDRKFLDLVIKDLNKSTANLRQESSIAQNSDLRNYAESQIPVLQRLLDKGKDLQSRIEK